MAELDLNELLNKCLSSLYSCTENISKYVTENKEKTSEFNKLRDCVKEYCKMEHQQQFSRKVLISLENESEITDSDSLHTKYHEELSHRTKSKPNFKKHQYMTDLEKHIKAVEQSTNEDPDFAITESQEIYIDPLSKKHIRNPVRNTICNHVYEKETIEKFIQNRKNKGCPYMGCSNKQNILPQHLELDEALHQRIMTSQQAEEEEDDE